MSSRSKNTNFDLLESTVNMLQAQYLYAVGLMQIQNIFPDSSKN